VLHLKAWRITSNVSVSTEGLPVCALLMQDTTCLLKLFQLFSKHLFSLFPIVTSSHLNKWFCFPMMQHRYCLLLGRNCHFVFASCVHFSSITISRAID
jgi:hypothetical protein